MPPHRGDADALRVETQALAGLERYGDAVAAFEHTLVLLPYDTAALTGFADCYELLGEFEKMTAGRILLGELDSGLNVAATRQQVEIAAKALPNTPVSGRAPLRMPFGYRIDPIPIPSSINQNQGKSGK